MQINKSSVKSRLRLAISPFDSCEVTSLPVMKTCSVRLWTSAHFYSNYGTLNRYFLIIFGFNFTIVVNVKIHQQKGSWPWRFVVNWKRLQRRSRPWELKQVEGFSFTTTYPFTRSTRRWLMHAVSWTNQRNGYRTRSRLKITTYGVDGKVTGRKVFMRHVLTQGQKCWFLPQRSAVSHTTWCMMDTAGDPDG